MHPVELLLYLTRHFKRLIVFGLPLLVLSMFALTYDKFRIDGDLRSWYDDDAAQIIEHEAFVKAFGSDAHIIVVIHKSDGIIDPSSLGSIRRITEALRKISHIERVYSLSNAPYIGVDPRESSDIIIENLIPLSSSSTPEVLGKIVQRLQQSDGLLSRLLSDDLRTSVIIGRLDNKLLDNDETRAMITDVRSILDSEHEQTGLRYLIHGSPVIKLAFVDIAKEDIRRFTPAVFLTALLLLLIAFRSWYAALLPILVIIMTTMTILCLYFLFGLSLNNFTATIPVFILAIGIADSVHIYWIWRLYRQHGYSNDKAIAYSLRKNTFPAFLTTATTFIGFGTLMLSDIIPLRILGVAIATSSLIAFVYSTLYIPSFLAWKNPDVKVRYPSFSTELSSQQERLYTDYSRLLIRYHRSIITITAVLTAIVASGIFFVRIDTDTIKMFPSDMPVRTDLAFIQKNLTGPVTLEVMVDSKREGAVYDPLFLTKAEQFSLELLAKDPAIRHIFSPVDLLKRMHSVFNEGRSDHYLIPEHSDVIEQYFTMYSYAMPQGSTLSDHIDSDERSIRLSIRLNALSSAQNLEIIEWIKTWWHRHGYSATVNGKVALSAYLNTETSRTMFYTVALNITIIALLFFLLFRRSSPVIFALLPNIIPLLAVVGMMGWLGISIDMGLVTSIVIILGVAMDATIYFVVKYRRALAKGKSIEDALVYMLTYTGVSNILSTLILISSLSLLTFSQFTPNMEFGYITLFALSISLLTDLLLLPALLIFWHEHKQQRKS